MAPRVRALRVGLPLVAIVLVVAVVVLVAGADGGAGPRSTDSTASDGPATPTTAAAATTAKAAPPIGKVSDAGLARAIGQKIVARYAGATPSMTLLHAARAGHVGGVILFGDNIPSGAVAARAVKRLQAAARAGGEPPLLVLVDQEGGAVKRLPAAPPAHSAAAIGAGPRPATVARAEGRATGAALRRLGINVDLAPVADVAATTSWLGTRSYGSGPTVVAQAACAFASGLAEAGVGATLKHFPGLGSAPVNTDDAPSAVRVSRSALRHALAAYRRCGSWVPMVMVSSAVYSALPGGAPAVMTPAVYRRELPAVGFHGVTISDDLETPAIASLDHPSRHAVRAGLDLLLYGQHEQTALEAYGRLLTDARRGRLGRQAVVVASADRIRALKRRIAR
jgi:beta-N-acetylhexosaminidase